MRGWRVWRGRCEFGGGGGGGGGDWGGNSGVGRWGVLWGLLVGRCAAIGRNCSVCC